jgi:WD40 repeat protein
VEFFAHDGPVAAAMFQPDGKHIVTVSDDKTAKLWTLALVWQSHQAGPVRQALFTPKGDRVLSGGGDGKLQWWNAADGKALKSIPAHEGAVAGVAVSGDGTKFASIGADKALKVWTTAAPGAKEEKEPLTIALVAPASAVTLSPDGKRVAASVTDAADTQLHVFDAESGKELVSLGEHTGAVSSLAFLADNRTLVSAGADKTVRLSDVNLLSVIDAHAGGVAGCAFLPGGVQAVSGGADKTVKLWNLNTGKMVKTFGPMPHAITAVAVSKDGLQVGAAAGKMVKIWAVADGKEVATLTHPAEVAALWFSPDKTKIATAAADGFSRIWDAATGRELQSFPHNGAVRAVVYHPSAPAIVAGGADKTATVETFSLVRSVAVGSAVNALTVTPNGSHVLTASADGKVKLWNAASGANERAFEGGDKPVRAVVVSKNNLYIATGGTDSTVRLYNFADGKLLAAIKAPGSIHGLSFSANNQMLAAACEDKSVQTWSIGPAQNGQPLTADLIKPLQTYTQDAAVADVVFAPDGNTLYSAGADKTIKQWKVASNAAVKSFQHPNFVDAVAFDNTGTRLATGCHDGKVRIWDVVKGQSIKEIAAHTMPAAPGQQPGPAAVYCVAWSADGKQILSGSLDTSLKLWDATTGALVREFHGYKPKEFEKGHHDGVFTAVFSPDGKSIVSGSSDRSIKVWNLADGTVTRDLTDPNLKPGAWPMAQPGWVYGVRFLPDGRLVSVGGAPRSHGFLATWDIKEGKMLTAEEMPFGTFFSVAVSPDGQTLAIGAGGAPGAKEVNGYIMKTPTAK